MKSAETLALNGRIWGDSANPLDIDTFALLVCNLDGARESAGVAPLERSGVSPRDDPTALPTSRIAQPHLRAGFPMRRVRGSFLLRRPAPWPPRPAREGE